MGHSNSGDVLFPILISTQPQKCSFFSLFIPFQGSGRAVSPQGKIWVEPDPSTHLPGNKATHSHGLSRPAFPRAVSRALILAGRVPIRLPFLHFFVVGDKANRVLQNSERPRRQRGRQHKKEKLRPPPREVSQSTDWRCPTPGVSTTKC